MRKIPSDETLELNKELKKIIIKYKLDSYCYRYTSGNIMYTVNILKEKL